MIINAIKESYPLEFHCKAQLIGIGQFVRCLEDSPSGCSFAVPVGNAYFCTAPYRLELVKEEIKTPQQKEDATG